MSQDYVVSLTTPAGPKTYNPPYAEEGHDWVDQMGYSAPVVAWLMPAAMAASILSDLGALVGSAREVSITLGDPADATNYVSVARVIVIGTVPADNPQRVYLLLTDVRWYINHEWVAIDGNWRRRVGDTYLAGNTLYSATPADVVAYAPWSINNGAAFTFSTFATQLLTYLGTARHGRPAISFQIDAFTVLSFQNNVIQETSTDANGVMGLARAAEVFGGAASARVDKTGKIHICEATPTAEETLVASFPTPLNDHGCIIKINRAGCRPAGYFRIYLDYELELRCTYNASGLGLYSTVNSTDPFLIPVLRVTDQAGVTIPAGTYFGGVVRAAPTLVGQGSIIGQDEAFAAWGVPPGQAYFPTLAGLGNLTDDFVALHWFDGSLENMLPMSVALSGQPDPIWVARIAELKRSYRTLFRVNPKAWDRVRHAWDVRAAVWDPATGSRAFSPVYANFNLTPADPTTDATFADLSVNVTTSYTSTGLLTDGNPSGFPMRLRDLELGILEVDRSDLSKFPKYTAVEISDVESPATLTGHPYPATPPDEVAWQILRSSQGGRGGSAAWKLATILSVAPASPNDLRRLYEVLVDVQTAWTTAGGAGGFAQNCYGPDAEERSQLGQARAPWKDDTGYSDVIFNTLAFDDATPDVNTDEPVSYCTVTAGTPAFTNLRPINATQEVIPIAQAIAAQKLLTMLDCRVGVQAIPGSQRAIPIGTLKKVTHRVTRGRFVSICECVEPDANQFNPENFLPASARSYLLQTTVTQR